MLILFDLLTIFSSEICVIDEIISNVIALNPLDCEKDQQKINCFTLNFSNYMRYFWVLHSLFHLKLSANVLMIISSLSEKKLPNLDGNSMNFINHWLIIHNLDNIINFFILMRNWFPVGFRNIALIYKIYMRYHKRGVLKTKWLLFYYRANELHVIIRTYLLRAYLPRSLSPSPRSRGACKYWIRIFSTNLFHLF